MAVKRKAINLSHGTVAVSKRQRITSSDFFESQDVWKNLNRVRTRIPDSEVNKKNSWLFIPIYGELSIENAIKCTNALREYIESNKIQFHLGRNDQKTSGFICLQDFNVLDCCLVLSVIFAARNKSSIIANSKDVFTIPPGNMLSGRFFLPNNCIHNRNNFPDNQQLKITKAKFTNIIGFQEYHVSLPKKQSLSYFTEGLSSHFASLKFGKSKKSLDKKFNILFSKFLFSLKSSVYFTSLPQESLFDMAKLVTYNKPIVENSRKNLLNYVEKIIDYNNGKTSTEIRSEKIHTQKQTTPIASNRQRTLDADITNRYTAPKDNGDNVNSNTGIKKSGENTSYNVGNSGYLTQDQIKQHCQATIRAAMDTLKNKSPYQIFTMYVKCPRQKYIDLVYQDLNDLRSKSNCNIVVLNLNNLNEAKAWFETLDLSKYTSVVRAPHPTTIRIISVGGVGENMLKALELISQIMDT